MKKHREAFIIFILAAGGLARAQSEALEPGVVIEKVAVSLGAEKAGLKHGDVVLAWSCGEIGGRVDSPFDLTDAEVNRFRCKHGLTVYGNRRTKYRRWTLGQAEWGAQVRPHFTSDIESVYAEGQDLAAKDQLGEAVERWRSIGSQAEGTESWLRPWLLLRLAQLFADQKRWKEADELYRVGVEETPRSKPLWVAQALYAWAETFLTRSDWDNAQKSYERALTEAQKDLTCGRTGTALRAAYDLRLFALDARC